MTPGRLKPHQAHNHGVCGAYEFKDHTNLGSKAFFYEYAAGHQQHAQPLSLSLSFGHSESRHIRSYVISNICYNTLSMCYFLQTEPGLPCGWLDQFYGHVAGPAHHLPHEEDISAFLHEDCSPQPPCACSGLKFDGSDPGRETWRR